MSWHPVCLGEHAGGTGDGPGSWLAQQAILAYSPPAGRFSWDPGYPVSLASMWSPDAFNVILRGAVKASQSEHRMAVNGVASPAGDAVHYFPRSSYGFEQSMGCVELPYGAAEVTWPYLTYGSLTVPGGRDETVAVSR